MDKNGLYQKQYSMFDIWTMRYSSWQCHSSCFCRLYESGAGVRLRRCLYEFSFGHCWAWVGGASVEILSEANLFIQTNCKCNSLLLVTAPIVINILNTATIVIGNIIVFSIIIISRLAIIIIIVVIIIVIIIVIILQSRHSCSLSSPAGWLWHTTCQLLTCHGTIQRHPQSYHHDQHTYHQYRCYF